MQILSQILFFTDRSCNGDENQSVFSRENIENDNPEFRSETRSFSADFNFAGTGFLYDLSYKI